MTIPPNIKAKIDELKLEERVAGAAATVEKAVHTGIGKAGEFVHTHNDQIKSALDNATTKIHDKTGGKYDGAVDKVRGLVDAGVSKIAGQRDDVAEAGETVADTATGTADAATDATQTVTDIPADTAPGATDAAADAPGDTKP